MNRIHPGETMQSGSNLFTERKNYFRSLSENVVGVEAGLDEETVGSGGGRRRTWTMRNNAARQMAVNFMPSRQNDTGRLSQDKAEELELMQRMWEDSRQGAAGEEKQADIIVREMERDHELMEDNPEAEELRREALRELPQCLTMKRTVRAKISASVSLRSQHRPVPLSKRLKYRLSFAIKRTRLRVKDVFFSIEPWYEAIRTVEGHFGSAVGTYFYFLRSLLLTDLALAVLLLAFVVLPQLVHEARVPAAIAAPEPPAATDAVEAVGLNGFLDLLSGQGMFEDTVLFYGHYYSGVVHDSSYSITYAYFFTMLSLYIFFFGFHSIRTAWSYRRNFIETAGGLGQVYAAKVFCGWDFGIATGAAAALNSRSIYNELKELLSEQNKKESGGAYVKWTQLLVNVAVNCGVLALIGGILALFWWLLSEREGAGTADGRWPLTMAAIVTVTLTVCPIAFSRLVRLESYGPRASVYVTLARTYLLDAATLLLLLIFWFRKEVACWETMLGQEIYRLILLDVIFSVILIPLFELIRGAIYQKFFPTLNLEFDIAYNSLCLVYNQALLWLGMLFSPLLAVFVTLKMFLTFYVKRGVLLRVCRPSRKVWRAAQTQTVLNMLQFLSLLGTLFVLAYFFISSSSQQCGPFQEYQSVWMVVTEGLLSLSQRPALLRLLTFLTRPGVIGIVLIFLCVLVYYVRGKALAQKSMVGILREMLVLEAKDKEFLLAAIAKVSNGEWMYSPKPEGEHAGDDSHTWRYLNDANVRKPSNSAFHFGRAEPVPSNPDGRPASLAGPSERRPASHHLEEGESDSSFSWQGSGYLNQPSTPHESGHVKKWL